MSKMNVRTLCLVVMLLAGVARSTRAQGTGPVHVVEQSPVKITKILPDVYLVDFGRVAFGNLSLALKGAPLPPGTSITFRFGEALKGGRVDTHPPGSVRYAQVTVPFDAHAALTVAPPADKRNTASPAVLTPEAEGVLIPFRWVEVIGWPSSLKPDEVQRRAVFDSTWSDKAATFHSSSPILDQVWDLCHYSIKATTFAGIFVDGDRERLAYEADAFINQLGYYAGDADPRIARATFDRLIRFPTWPSEWTPQMVFIAYADWMETGDVTWLRDHYEELKTKLLSDRVGPDGLVTSSQEQIKRGDIVDWPPQERDGYVFTSVNTVVNAFHLRALAEMADLATVLGKTSEARAYQKQEAIASASFQAKLFDPSQGLYRDGEGTNHVSLHGNLFPLAFGLVPAGRGSYIAQWLAHRGMAGSVYAAQYLLEALFQNNQSAAALDLMIAPGDRSWKHMVDAGATITWEAWDQKYKPNQDWTHAWGAAPANLLPKYVLGAQPFTPGWHVTLVQPHPGDLSHAEGKVPTPLGELSVSWTRAKSFHLSLALPPAMTAKVKLPALPGLSHILVAGRPVSAHLEGEWWVLDEDFSGKLKIEER